VAPHRAKEAPAVVHSSGAVGFGTLLRSSSAATGVVVVVLLLRVFSE
jgi:hypothetical protein